MAHAAAGEAALAGGGAEAVATVGAIAMAGDGDMAAIGERAVIGAMAGTMAGDIAAAAEIARIKLCVPKEQHEVQPNSAQQRGHTGAQHQCMAHDHLM